MSTGRQLFVLGAWVVIGVLALVAAGRLTHLDDTIGWPYSGINAFTPYVYLPAYAAIAVGFALRRNLLTAAAAVMIVVHLVWIVPEVWPGSPAQAPAGASRLRLLAANLQYDNPTAGGLGAQIRARKPDIVVLEELSPETYGELRRAHALDGYTYHAVHIDDVPFGSGVFSRFPLSGDAAPLVADLPSQRVTVTLPGGRRFTLFAVHTISPTSVGYTKRWRVQLANLRGQAEAAARRGAPVVFAGDFNATRDHRPFRRLVGAGLSDAHDDAHAGWAPTWSATSGLLPTTIRIDHVLVSKAFTVTGYGTGTRYGSDHLPIVADLALR